MKMAEVLFHSFGNLGEYLELIRRTPFKKTFFRGHKNCSKQRLQMLGKQLYNHNCCWNQLPKDTLEKIALELSIGDRIRTSSVCQDWRSILTSKDIQLASEIPWLVLPHDPYSDHVDFYSLSEGRIYKLKLPEQVPWGWLCGVRKEWLIMAAGPDFAPDVFLWNPMSREVIRLPPITTIPCYNDCMEAIGKHGISSVIHGVEVFSSSSAQRVVAASFGYGRNQNLAFCTPQDKSWGIAHTFKDDEGIEDLLFHKGILYVVILDAAKEEDEDHEDEEVNRKEPTYTYFTENLKLSSDCEFTMTFIFEKCPRRFTAAHKKYYPSFWIAENSVEATHLAESTNGELLLIHTAFDLLGPYLDDVPEGEGDGLAMLRPLTSYFSVDVVDMSNTTHWRVLRLKSLGDQALFVAQCGSISHESEIHRNCIHFLPVLFSVDGTGGSPVASESGVFYLDGRRIKCCFPTSLKPIKSRVGWYRPKLPS